MYVSLKSATAFTKTPVSSTSLMTPLTGTDYVDGTAEAWSHVGWNLPCFYTWVWFGLYTTSLFYGTRRGWQLLFKIPDLDFSLFTRGN